jgi:ankyrin repeat protein
MNAFPDIERYIFDFGFSPIHIAMLGRYNSDDALRPSLQSLIDFVDEANNAPLGTDWKTYRRKDAQSSPLYKDLIEIFRAKAETLPKYQKPIIDVIDLCDDKWGWPPFHWAAFTGRRKEMEILLQNSANVFMESPMERNILHIAAESKRPEVLSYVLSIWEKHKDRLDINKPDRWRETPLHVAAYNSSACCKLLIDSGADPNSRQENNQIPLHYASNCRAAERLGVVEALCQAQGVQIDAQDEVGRTPILELLDFPDCVEILVNNGADLTIVDTAANSVIHQVCIDDEPAMLERLLELTPDLEATKRRNKNGNTPLLEGLAHKSTRCVQHLLKSAGSEIDIAGKDGWRPVHHAAKWGNINILKAIMTHPEFQRGRLTDEGRSSEWIAKDACVFVGEVRELLRKYDSISASINQHEERTVSHEATLFYLSMR